MKAIIEEKIVKETVGYEAIDGKIFKDAEECRKYENTCKAVLMAEYKPLVKGWLSEYYLYETGGEEYGWDIVEIKSAQDLEAVNKVLKYYHNEAKIIPFDYIGKIILVTNGYDGIEGYWTTFDVLKYNMETSYLKVVNKALGLE